MKRFIILATVCLAGVALASCQKKTVLSSDETQSQQQEKILQEGTAAVGMPAIKNFREKRILKDIYEMRDQNGLVTYTYLENMIPTRVPGHTSLGGKLTFYCVSVGYAIPASTQFTNPQQVGYATHGVGVVTLPQADPNGLFSPSSAEGSWVMCKSPDGKNTLPTYSEPKLITSPFKHPVD